MEEDNTDLSDKARFDEILAEVTEVTSQFFASHIEDPPDPLKFGYYQKLLVQELANKFGSPNIDTDALEYSDPGHIARDYGTVMLFNHINLASFIKVPPSERALFLPECLTARRKCAAEEHERYISCAHCNACSISSLVDLANEYGYSEERSFIVSGGSVIPALISRNKIRALVGVACYNELYAFLELFKGLDSPPPAQMILLTKWGCRNTRFTFSQAEELFSSITQYEESPE